MPYEISLFPTALSTLRSLDAGDYRQLRRALDALSEDPLPRDHARLSQSNAYSLRVGEYRIFYEIHEQTLLVPVIRIGHRNYFL